MEKNIEENIDSCKDVISLITTDLIKEAIKKLKCDKSDVSGDFTSDCLKGAPDIFLAQPSKLFQPFSVMTILDMICLCVL